MDHDQLLSDGISTVLQTEFLEFWISYAHSVLIRSNTVKFL